MRPPIRRRRLQRFGNKTRANNAGRLAKKPPALSGELVNSDTKSASLFQAANLWQFGDWAALASLGARDGSRTRKAGKIALLSASANLQQGAKERAGELLREAKKSGCSNREIASILVAGAHLNLGKASFLASCPTAQYRMHFQKAARAIFGTKAAYVSARAIEAEQLAQIGAPNIWRKPDLPFRRLGREADRVIDQLIQAYPNEPVFFVAKAEIHQRRGEYSEAIRKWQRVQELLGPQTPQEYYDRLASAYEMQGLFPRARESEEEIFGSFDKHFFIKRLHEHINPSLYFEIGVHKGKSLALAKCTAIGVDPMPLIRDQLPPSAKLFKQTSDEFFSKSAVQALERPPDLVFIDGMHLFEFVLRDFINVELYSGPNTVVLIDDIFPCTQAQAQRDRKTGNWTGDVWKLYDILEKKRPDLSLHALDAYPTGLLLVTNLDSGNRILSDHYEELVSEYAGLAVVPERFLRRERAVRGTVSEVIVHLKSALRPS